MISAACSRTSASRGSSGGSDPVTLRSCQKPRRQPGQLPNRDLYEQPSVTTNSDQDMA